MKSISLIGMPGAGKTSTAKELGLLLSDFVVVDTDELIIRNENMTIPEIFAKFGEKYFRNAENKVIKEVFAYPKRIVSLGGGAFESAENQQIIKENSIVIYLKATPETIFARLNGKNDRPLLSENFSVEKIEEILTLRDDNYQKSDIIVETDSKTPTQVAQEITEVLKDEFHG